LFGRVENNPFVLLVLTIVSFVLQTSLTATYPFLQAAIFFLIADTITISAKVNRHFSDTPPKQKPFRPQRLYNAVAGLNLSGL